MPVYNGEQFLKETMKSVLLQTFTDFTFMIINDGSTDKSEQIIKSFDDKRILYLENEKNLGLVATLNKGIELCTTEYLARMDADDLWEPKKLEMQVNLMDNRKEVGLCGTSVRKFGNINGDFIFPQNNDELKVGFIFYCTMSHPSVVFRMSFLKETGLRYKSEYFPAEDYKMWLDCLHTTQIFNFPDILVHYRMHEQQISHDKADYQKTKTDRVRLEVLERIYPDVSEQEKEFHLNEFVLYKINTKEDVSKHIKWAKRLQAENLKTNYIKESVFKDQLNIYLQASIKGYIIGKFFNVFSVRSFCKYMFSAEWRYLSFRRNLGILKKCLP